MRSVKADFTFGKQLGAGTYGIVWQATRRLDNQTYAIKELDLRLLDRQASLCPHQPVMKGTPAWSLVSVKSFQLCRSKQTVYRKSKCWPA